MSPFRILAVDDNLVNLTYLHKTLQRYFSTLIDFQNSVFVSSAADAKLALTTSRFDLGLLDIDLGSSSIDGVELAQQIRTSTSVNRNIALVATTTDVTPSQIERYRENFQGCIAKPLSTRKLSITFERLSHPRLQKFYYLSASAESQLELVKASRFVEREVQKLVPWGEGGRPPIRPVTVLEV